jgi:hypothetical protein
MANISKQKEERMMDNVDVRMSELQNGGRVS